MGFIDISDWSSPPKSYTSTIAGLYGGLNLHDIPWQIQSTQSPEMKNFWWENGALRSRPDQTTYNDGLRREITDDATGVAYPGAHHKIPYNGWHVFRSGNNLYAVPEGPLWDKYTVIPNVDVGWKRGTFFLYDGILYYKYPGGYIKITASETLDEELGLYPLQAEEVEPYIPTTYINANPSTGAGDAYQPYNRMSAWRRITYTCPETDDGVFLVPEAVTASETPDIIVEYLGSDGSWVTFEEATFDFLSYSVKVYGSSPILTALVDAGTIAVSNNVRITYKACANDSNNIDTQYESIMQCNIAEVYGGGNGLCVVLAGYEGQANAYFWSGNTSVAMDPTYFPVEHYNLAGDASDPITALGKQQSMLVIFQERSVGRASMSTTEIDGRVFITMDFLTINPDIGCDMPGSIQLVENNLVFANRKRGVMYVKDTSSAYENNIIPLSQNVEKPRDQAGILYDLNVAPGDEVCSYDDGTRYWLCINEHAWLWDYSLGYSSDASKLSWFYLDNIWTPTFLMEGDDGVLSYMGLDGYLRRFVSLSEDTFNEDGVWLERGEDCEKIVSLPIQDFGTYECLKNVNKCIFVVQGTGNAIINIEYETDYTLRYDRTPIMTYGWSLVPRNLAFRNLKVFPFAVTAVRKPGCRNVRHFQVRLKNTGRGQQVSFVSAQIYFTYQGVDR